MLCARLTSRRRSSWSTIPILRREVNHEETLRIKSNVSLLIVLIVDRVSQERCGEKRRKGGCAKIDPALLSFDLTFSSSTTKHHLNPPTTDLSTNPAAVAYLYIQTHGLFVVPQLLLVPVLTQKSVCKFIRQLPQGPYTAGTRGPTVR